MTHPDSTSRTPRGLALAPLLAASTLGIFTPGIATAQSDAPDCVAIVAEMLAPSPSAGSIRASAGCPSSGPVTLASRWLRRGTRSATERAALVEASSLVRDGRLYDALLDVAKDEARPLSDRLAGIRLLVSYAGDGYTVSQQGQALDAKAASAPTATKQTESAAPVGGSVPIAPTVRADVKREMSKLASSAGDGDVRYAAQKASESLGYVAPPKAKVARYRAP